MNKEQVALGLTEQFLPQFSLCNPGQDSQAPEHSERIRQYTYAAITIFDDPMHSITVWGYSPAFNPFAFVETLPPNFHYLLQSGQFLIDPTRTVLTQTPIVLDRISVFPAESPTTATRSVANWPAKKWPRSSFQLAGPKGPRKSGSQVACFQRQNPSKQGGPKRTGFGPGNRLPGSERPSVIRRGKGRSSDDVRSILQRP